jgi:hypothetical protein
LLFYSGVVAEESNGNVSELDLWVDVPIIDIEICVFCETGSKGIQRMSNSCIVEHLQTMQSGDWPPSQPPWITRNNLVKVYYEGSIAHVPFKHRVKRGVGLSDSQKPDVRTYSFVCSKTIYRVVIPSISKYSQ